MAEEVDLIKVIAGINWTAVLVALATGLTAFGGNVWISWRQARREQASVRAALLAEVKALMDVVERRGYLQGLREGLAGLEAYDPAKELHRGPEDFILRVKIPEHYNRVYQANVTRLGCLKASEAEKIVRFYQLCDSVKADVTEGGVLYEGTTELAAFKESLAMLESAMEIGRSLTRRCAWAVRQVQPR